MDGSFQPANSNGNRQMREARRLLADARGKLEQHDRDRVADRVDKAIHEVDDALNNSNNGN